MFYAQYLFMRATRKVNVGFMFGFTDPPRDAALPFVLKLLVSCNSLKL